VGRAIEWVKDDMVGPSLVLATGGGAACGW
jgi:hypothetical protein